MTATNHMLAGAAMATGLQRPLLVIPLAIASHFVLDIVPHFGIHEHDPAARNKHPLFRYVLTIDAALAIALLLLLPAMLSKGVSWWVVALGMLSAWAPDAAHIRHFVQQIRGRQHRLSWFSRFHARIQWFERPLGVVVELIWFLTMGVFLGYLAA